MKKNFATIMFFLTAAAAHLLGQQLSGNNTGLYGVTAYKLNGQAVASQYAQWSLPSLAATSPGAFAFQPSFAYVQLGGGRSFIPFSTGCPVKILDAVPANTEIVTPASVTISASQFVLALPAANPHTSYSIVSGTGGLCEAQKDLGVAGGTILVTQEFYDKGFNASTIASLAGGAAGNFILDVSLGRNDTYGWNGTGYKLIQTNSNNHLGFGNTDVVGTLTLAGGAATLTFAKSFTTAPVCVGTDTTAANAVKISTTATAATFAGTTTDVIAYLCFGNPN